MPKTRLGKWSVGLIIVFFALLFAGRLVAAATGGGGETFYDNIPLSLTMLSAVLSSVAAFFVGLVAVVKRHERSVMVYLSMLIGFLFLGFVLGELLGPEH